MTAVRCIRCASAFDLEALPEDVHACSSCGTTSLPVRPEDDVTVVLNWQELRILGVWASNWAGQPLFPEDSRATLDAILKRLQAQHPDRTPLSLAAELKHLAAVTGSEVKLVHPSSGATTTFTPPKNKALPPTPTAEEEEPP